MVREEHIPVSRNANVRNRNHPSTTPSLTSNTSSVSNKTPYYKTDTALPSPHIPHTTRAHTESAQPQLVH